MKVLYKLDTFEGPLDLLLHLIEESEIDIYNIPISDITDQYMLYIQTMQELELDITSEFVVMASTLLKIKSQMLLPKPPVMDTGLGEDEDFDPRAELVAKLIEYRKYKEMAEELREKELERSKIFTRAPSDLTPYMPQVQENPLKGIHIADIVFAFQKSMKRVAKRNVVTKIERDELSVKDRIHQLLEILKDNGGKILFSRLFDEDMYREEIVVSFLAILELMKRKLIVCYQYALFEDIVIQHREGDVGDEAFTDEINY